MTRAGRAENARLREALGEIGKVLSRGVADERKLATIRRLLDAVDSEAPTTGRHERRPRS